MHLRRHLWVRRGAVQSDRRRIVHAYLASDPPFVGWEALRLAERVLGGEALTDDEERALRVKVEAVQGRTNAHLGITV